MVLPGQYARSGLLRGLAFEEELGVNPYKFGMVGASDNHNGLTTHLNDNFFGKFVSDEPRPDRAMHVAKQNSELGLTRYGWRYITSGLSAVWAESNTREAIFDAMERKEVYATTGPRIRVRFFGGWSFDEADAQRRDLALIGYTKGVPMGSDLRPGDGAPSSGWISASAVTTS